MKTRQISVTNSVRPILTIFDSIFVLAFFTPARRRRRKEMTSGLVRSEAGGEGPPVAVRTAAIVDSGKYSGSAQ